MRYWDSSALVPLIVSEDRSAEAGVWLSEDSDIVTWVWSAVEIAGAIERRARDGSIEWAARRSALARLEAASRRWDEVVDPSAVRARALPLLSRHPLRAADAAQLGAALLVAESGAKGLTFVSLDTRLTMAAEREGLSALPQPG